MRLGVAALAHGGEQQVGETPVDAVPDGAQLGAARCLDERRRRMATASGTAEESRHGAGAGGVRTDHAPKGGGRPVAGETGLVWAYGSSRIG